MGCALIRGIIKEVLFIGSMCAGVALNPLIQIKTALYHHLVQGDN
jgi:hypothetical protein